MRKIKKKKEKAFQSTYFQKRNSSKCVIFETGGGDLKCVFLKIFIHKARVSSIFFNALLALSISKICTLEFFLFLNNANFSLLSFFQKYAFTSFSFSEVRICVFFLFRNTHFQNFPFSKYRFL